MTDQVCDVCPECGERKLLWLIREDVILCDECAFNEGWIQCCFCKDFYPYGVIEFTELDDGREVCEYCMEDIDELLEEEE